MRLACNHPFHPRVQTEIALRLVFPRRNCLFTSLPVDLGCPTWVLLLPHIFPFIYADESVSLAARQKIFSPATAALQEGSTKERRFSGPAEMQVNPVHGIVEAVEKPPDCANFLQKVLCFQWLFFQVQTFSTVSLGPGPHYKAGAGWGDEN